MEIYGGSSRRRYVSASEIQKMKEGGAKADAIRKKSNLHHQTIDSVEAEKILNENIDDAYTEGIEQENIENQKFLQKTWWEKVKDFFRRLFFAPRS